MFAPVVLTEQLYVQLLYILQRGPVSAGAFVAGNGGRYFAPWIELAHLDRRLPPASTWPPVVPADLDRERWSVPDANLLAAQGFAHQLGSFAGLPLPELVPVIPITERPTVGAVRTRRRDAPAVPAPITIGWNIEDADRFSRTRSTLDQMYRRMWQHDAPSDDARDMWRAYDADGTRRWRPA
jgi:hypothetical protein